MKTVTESIYCSPTLVVPLADVSWIQKSFDNQKNPCGLVVVMKHTRWDNDSCYWGNHLFIPEKEREEFLKSWTNYRHELEIETLKDLTTP